MNARSLWFVRWTILVVVISVTVAFAQSKDDGTTELPKPVVTGGVRLMEALKNRQSVRSFSAKKLEPQTLSNLLWAACGINRPGEGKRTAPSAFNAREIDVYVATADGLFLFVPEDHVLKTVLKKDVRAQMGGQAYVRQAPVNLIYVADFSKLKRARGDEEKLFYAAADTGYISQNVYLFCASEGLGTVVYAGARKKTLAKTMKLRPDQRIILAQAVGHRESK